MMPAGGADPPTDEVLAGSRRDRAMEARVERTLAEAGVTEAAAPLVLAAHRLAMAPRVERIGDARHPDFLHPGRTVLILLLDTPYRDAVGLAAAALLESEREELRVGPAAVRAEVGEEVASFLAAVPLPGPDLAEVLVTAPHEVRLVALAERLDHCRHAKFWADRESRARALEQAEAIFGPVAERTDPTLARRFSHWCGAFGRTLGRGG